MKKIFILGVLLTNFLYGATLTVEIDNGKLLGKAYLLLYKGKDGFLKEDKAYKKISFNLEPNITKVSIPDLLSGEYAYTIYHDENKNGKLDTNFMKIPKEATGFSNNFRPKFKPNYDNFKFDLNEDVFQKVDLK